MISVAAVRLTTLPFCLAFCRMGAPETQSGCSKDHGLRSEPCIESAVGHIILRALKRLISGQDTLCCKNAL